MEAAQHNQGQGAHSFPLLHLPSVLELSDQAEGESLRPANPSVPGLEKTGAGMRLAMEGRETTTLNLLDELLSTSISSRRGKKKNHLIWTEYKTSVLNRYEGEKSDEKNWFTVLQILTNMAFF